MLWRLAQSLNAFESTNLKLLGRTMLRSEEQPQNDPIPTPVAPSGIVTSVRLVQFKNM